MMSDIPLDRLGSEAGFNETFVTDNQTTPNLPEIAPPDSVLPSPTGPSLSRRITSALCCPCGCETNTQSTPLHQIQPVILRPNNDVYLELKPNRRLRVIHIPPGATLSSSQQNQTDGIFTDTSPSQMNNNNDNDDEDDAEYWFDSADPKRPQIEAQNSKSAYSNQQRRIFHKLAPQERPAVPGSKLDKNFISPARLPRKKFLVSKSDKDDLKSGDEQILQQLAQQESPPKRNVTKSKENSPEDDDRPMDKPLEEIVTVLDSEATAAYLNDSGHRSSDDETDGGRKSPKKFDAESPDSTFVSVVTIPDPGESHTDDDDGHRALPTENAVVSVSGSFLGGVANIGFEAEEETDAGHDRAVLHLDRDSPRSDSFDAGYKRNRNLSDVNISWNSEADKDDGELSEDSNSGLPETKPDELSHPVIRETADNEPPADRSPILFFIHGVGGSADSWQNQLSYFSGLGYEVIAPDLLGHGFSSTPDKVSCYTFPKLFRDVLTVFDHFCVAGGRQNSTVIIGHSYGCSFATAIARSRPDHVKVLALIASGGPTALAPPSAVTSDPNKLLSCLDPILAKCGFVQRKQAKIKGKSTGIHDGFDVPAYVLQHTLMGQSWPEGDVAFHRRITIPTLLVYGLKDGFVSLVEMCEMERTIPKSYLELIPLAGHHVMQDQPKELNAMIKKFIEKYQPSKK